MPATPPSYFPRGVASGGMDWAAILEAYQLGTGMAPGVMQQVALINKMSSVLPRYFLAEHRSKQAATSDYAEGYSGLAERTLKQENKKYKQQADRADAWRRTAYKSQKDVDSRRARASGSSTVGIVSPSFANQIGKISPSRIQNLPPPKPKPKPVPKYIDPANQKSQFDLASASPFSGMQDPSKLKKAAYALGAEKAASELLESLSKQAEQSTPSWMRVTPMLGAIAGGVLGARSAALRKLLSGNPRLAREALRGFSGNPRLAREALREFSLSPAGAKSVLVGAGTGATIGWLPSVFHDGTSALAGN
jgi:hypothetical protein